MIMLSVDDDFHMILVGHIRKPRFPVDFERALPQDKNGMYGDAKLHYTLKNAFRKEEKQKNFQKRYCKEEKSVVQ